MTDTDQGIVVRTPLSLIKESKENREGARAAGILSRTTALQPFKDLVDQINAEGGIFRYPDITYGARQGPLKADIPWINAEVLHIDIGPNSHIAVHPMYDEEESDPPQWKYRYVRGGRNGDREGVMRYYTLEEITTIILNELSEYVV